MNKRGEEGKTRELLSLAEGKKGLRIFHTWWSWRNREKKWV